jgi:hypothetical protein
MLGVCVKSGGAHSDQCALKIESGAQWICSATAGEKTLGPSLDDSTVREDTVPAVTLACEQ